MPIRLLRDGILDSDAVCSLSFPAEVFYRRLMSAVDDFGRFDGRLSVLRGRLYALQIDKVREADITRWIAECEKAGLIALYSAVGKPYVLFHKLGSPRAKESKYPAPPLADESNGKHLKADESNGKQMRADAPYSYSGSDTGSGTDSSEPAEPDSQPLPPLLEFPTVGTGGSSWALTHAHVAGWSSAYPNLDVLAECRKALAWIQANPAKRKTHGGMANFLVKWFSRTTDDVRSSTSRPVGRQQPITPPRDFIQPSALPHDLIPAPGAGTW